MRSVDWSHDGSRLVFEAGVLSPGGPSGPSDLYTTTPDGRDLHQVPNTNGAGRPRWSPDDSRLLFFRGCIVNAAADGTDQTTVPGACSGPGDWSPNGRRIVFALKGQDSVSRIWTSALDGTAREFIGRGLGDASYRPTG